MKNIGIVGAGAWGTAIAQVISSSGKKVTLWGLEEETVWSINEQRENTLFLPGVDLSENIKATTDIKEAVEGMDVVFFVTPAQYLRATCKQLVDVFKAGVPAVICSKGIENKTGALLSDVVVDELPDAVVAILSGPNFAVETAKMRPSAVTIACKDKVVGKKLVELIGLKTFRPYLTDDVIGSQIGGAVKNVLAIACGMVEGKKFGENARAALITRGVAELVRFAIVKGGHPETLMGLSGIGDLILTANSMQSRNYSLGVALGKGKTLEQIMQERSSVAEGIFTASAVTEVAKKIGVDMPICFAVNDVINSGASIDDIVDSLLSRPFKQENA
ncbi:MAG: NAD(P)-dependent glycerol-3-phosphate dehydrogenase [Alphaproteobacteria bacterium]|nr:NAD(P)-dependent glycerol-3-phosphate dehydrogenase [Alphaproteobacteria bacterium]